jgi:hypothetical protein
MLPNFDLVKSSFLRNKKLTYPLENELTFNDELSPATQSESAKLIFKAKFLGS